jgi:hypothetical protein
MHTNIIGRNEQQYMSAMDTPIPFPYLNALWE